MWLAVAALGLLLASPAASWPAGLLEARWDTFSGRQGAAAEPFAHASAVVCVRGAQRRTAHGLVVAQAAIPPRSPDVVRALDAAAAAIRQVAPGFAGDWSDAQAFPAGALTRSLALTGLMFSGAVASAPSGFESCGGNTTHAPVAFSLSLSGADGQGPPLLGLPGPLTPASSQTNSGRGWREAKPAQQASLPCETMPRAFVRRETRLPGLHRIQRLRVFVPGAGCLLPPAASAASGDVVVDVAVTMSVPHTAYVDVDEAHSLSRGHPSSSSNSPSMGSSPVSPVPDADTGPAFAAFTPFIDVERPAQSSARHVVAWSRRLRAVRSATSARAAPRLPAAPGASSRDQAELADAAVPRPRAEAGVAAGLDPGRAWLLLDAHDESSAATTATVDAEFRLPLHFRYQRPCRPGHNAAAPLAHRSCGSGWVALATPRIFVRAGGAGSWTELALDEGSAESFRLAEMESTEGHRMRSDSAGSAVQGHGGFATVPEGEFGADVLRPVPVGQAEAESLVRPVTVWSAWLAAGVVVAAIATSVV